MTKQKSSSHGSVAKLWKTALETRSSKLEGEKEAAYSQYRNKPLEFFREVVGWNPWAKQEDITLDLLAIKRVAVASCNGSGKCLAFGEDVHLSDGSIVAAESLIGRIFTINGYRDGAQVPMLARAEDNGTKPVVEIVTDSGTCVVRTLNHPLLVARRVQHRGVKPDPIGWVDAGDIKAGNLVLAPIKLSPASRSAVPDEHVKLCAYMLADGGLTKSTPLFTKSNGPQRAELAACAQSLGCRVNRMDDLTVSLVGQSRRQGNPITELLRSWGMLGKLSKHKRFPSWVWTLPDSQLALFLNRLWGCDGWVYSRTVKRRKSVQVGYSSASHGLLLDVVVACRRLGVSGRVDFKMAKYLYRGAVRRKPSWTFSVTRTPDVRKFMEVVRAYGKEDACLQASQILAERDESREHKWRTLRCPDGYRWETVKSVKRLGRQRTVAIEVPETNVFVGMLVEHNTALAARIVAWFLTTRRDAICITTSATGAQLYGPFWRNIRQVHATSKRQLGGSCMTKRWEFAPQWYAAGIASDDETQFQGFHAEGEHGELLVVIDEASGCANYVFDAIRGYLTRPKSYLLLLGNPNRADGGFAEIFKRQSESWARHEISAFDVPAHIMDPGWIEEMRETYGESSLQWQVRVLGKFPQKGADLQLFPLWLLEEAATKEPTDKGTHMGVDVARSGADNTVACLVRDGELVESMHWQSADTTVTTEQVVRLARSWNVPAGNVHIEVDGIGGAVVDRAREAGLECDAVQSGGSPLGDWRDLCGDIRFANRKSELYFALRQGLMKGRINVPSKFKLYWKDLEKINVEPDVEKGLFKLEPKKKLRARTGSSPDFGDALMISMSRQGATPRIYWI